MPEMDPAENEGPVSLDRVASRIVFLREQRVLIDADLARLYGVATKTLLRAVNRNLSRCPTDFMFRLTQEEFENLRYQFGTSSLWGGRRHRPFAFTEHGVAMLSSVLRSERAVQVNIEVVRAFVRLREMLRSNADLAAKIDELEKRYDGQFRVVFVAIRQLMEPAPKAPRRIGFELDQGAGG